MAVETVEAAVPTGSRSAANKNTASTSILFSLNLKSNCILTSLISINLLFKNHKQKQKLFITMDI